MSLRAFAILAGSFAALTVLVLATCAWPYEVDDAYLIARHARNVVRGYGLVMNPGGPRTDGVTEPLWLLPMLLGEALGGHGIVVAKVVGVAAAMFSAFRAAVFATRCSSSRPVAVWAALFAGFAPSVAIAAVSGLGTTLAGCLFTEAWIAALQRPEPRPRRAGAMLSMLAFTRPELALAALVLVLLLFARGRRAGLEAGGAALLGAVLVVVYRLVLFGHPLPLSALAKPAELGHGLSYGATGLVATGIGFVLLAAVASARTLPSEGKALALLIGTHAVAVVLAGGDWMPAYRLLVPLQPAAAALFAFVVVAVSGEEARARRPLSAIALSFALVLPLLDSIANLPRARASGAFRARGGRVIANRLAARCHRVALVDAGFLAYESGVEVVDLAGLVDPAIARLPGGHLDKALDPLQLALLDPDCILLHSSSHLRLDEEGNVVGLDGYPIERRVAAMRWVREEMRVDDTFQYSEDPLYEYALLVRRRP